MYISPYCRPVLVPPIFMKFGWGQLTDIITCVKFLVDRFRGYGVLLLQNCHFPLTCCVTLTTALPCDTVNSGLIYTGKAHLTCAYLIVWTFTSAAVVCLINSINPLLQTRLPIEAVPLIQAGIITQYIRLPSVMICLMITSYCMGNKLTSDWQHC